MRLIRGLHNLAGKNAETASASVVTIGNYDGLHLGHQKVLAELNDIARQHNLPSTVVVFEPTPLEFFNPEKAPARLTRFREKWDLIETAGIDQLLCLSFNHKLAQMDAEDFVMKILVDGLRTRHLTVGDDFRFGRGRQGDFRLLMEMGEKFNFSLQRMETVQIDNERISSMRIRRLLAQGDVMSAAHLLGRPYSVSGRVAYGQQLGRTIGFATANVNMNRVSTPLQGVYCVTVSGLSESTLPGVANLGVRPTLSGTQPRLEVHILDYQGDCYGKQIEVAFRHHLRDEQKFSSIEALRQQITKDVVQARQFFDNVN